VRVRVFQVHWSIYWPIKHRTNSRIS